MVNRTRQKIDPTTLNRRRQVKFPIA